MSDLHERPDGLRHHYDVILVGTGLVESILAA
jgi:RAB protein geranylgeranyltransferase component A